MELGQTTGMFENGQAPGASLQNEGTLVVEPGKTLHFERGASFEQTAGRTTLSAAGSRLAVFDSTGVILSGGILEGNGTVAANLTNGGEVRPGTSPGTLTVEGAYTQGPGGVLVAEIAASGHDDARCDRCGRPRRHARGRDRGGFHSDAGSDVQGRRGVVAQRRVRRRERDRLRAVRDPLPARRGEPARDRPRRPAVVVDRRRDPSRGRHRDPQRRVRGPALRAPELPGLGRLPDRERDGESARGLRRDRRDADLRPRRSDRGRRRSGAGRYRAPSPTRTSR